MDGNKLKTVYLHGGLGNQLHQISVALGLARVSSVQISTAFLTTSGRKFESLGVIKESKTRITSAVCFCKSRPKVLPAQNLLLSEIPCCFFTYPGQADWMFHEKESHEFFKFMQTGLKLGVAPTAPEVRSVAHFRLGDYLWPAAAYKYGVLKEQYFLTTSSVSLDSGFTMAVTEDENAFRRLHPKLIDSHNVKRPSGELADDLRLMAYANTFTAANSSLSLWMAWYRRVEDEITGRERLTFSPTYAYKTGEKLMLPGLGRIEPTFWSLHDLLLLNPWIISRRLAWQGRFW